MITYSSPGFHIYCRFGAGVMMRCGFFFMDLFSFSKGRSGNTAAEITENMSDRVRNTRDQMIRVFRGLETNA